MLLPLLETFGELFRDPAHWQFELLVGGIEFLVMDILIGALVWPIIKRHIHHDQGTEHAHEKKLEARVWMLEHPLEEVNHEG